MASVIIERKHDLAQTEKVNEGFPKEIMPDRRYFLFKKKDHHAKARRYKY